MGKIDLMHHTATIKVPNQRDCWAAAAAMVMHRHSPAGTQHVKNLAAAAKIPLDKGTLPDSSVRRLAVAVGLRFHEYPIHEITMAELEHFLRRGPVAAFGYFNFPGLRNSEKHAVAIYGLTGDGSDKRTIVHLIDPYAPGNPYRLDWYWFSTQDVDVTYVLSH